MTRIIGMLFLGFLGAKALAKAEWKDEPAGMPKKSSFRCVDQTRKEYALVLNESEKYLFIKSGKKTSKVRLAEPNLGRIGFFAGRPLVYNGLNPAGKNLDDRLDLSLEVVVHYAQEKVGEDLKTVGFIGMFIDHLEPKGLECKSQRHSLEVRAPGPEKDLPGRIARLAVETADLREPTAKLKPIAQLCFTESFERFVASPLAATPEGHKGFALAMAPAFKKVESNALSEVSKKYAPVQRKLWLQLVDASGYNYYPALERYLGWVVSGAKRTDDMGVLNPDGESIRMGLRRFLLSPSAKQADLVQYFSREMNEAIRGISPVQMNEIVNGLEEGEIKFLTAEWVKLPGNASYRTFEHGRTITQKAIEGIQEAAQGDVDTGINFAPFQLALTEFMGSSTFKKPDLRQKFMDNTRPYLKTLTPPQFEILMECLTPGEQAFVKEIVGK